MFRVVCALVFVFAGWLGVFLGAEPVPENASYVYELVSGNKRPFARIYYIPGKKAIAIGNLIVMGVDAKLGLLIHELHHVRQFYDSFGLFPLAWIAGQAIYGHNNPFEKKADDFQEEADERIYDPFKYSECVILALITESEHLPLWDCRKDPYVGIYALSFTFSLYKGGEWQGHLTKIPNLKRKGGCALVMQHAKPYPIYYKTTELKCAPYKGE